MTKLKKAKNCKKLNERNVVMYDVVALGEILIDFTPSGTSENGNNLYEQNPGGAPANVLAVLAKLGRKTAFIGKVGRDQFGYFLKDVLVKLNVDTKGLVFADDVNTTLAFVHLDKTGDRSFTFYRNPGADMSLKEEEVDYNLIKNSKILHFGSLSMTHEPSRTATLKALDFATKNNLIISYDPNLRPPLWQSLEEAKEMMLHGMTYTDILKISEEELYFLTGINDLSAGSAYLRDKYEIKLIFVTLGPKGCFYRIGDYTGLQPALDVKAVDTTGAGDAFLGSVLYKIIEKGKGIEQLTVSEIDSMVSFANTVAGITTTKRGAIPAIPTLKEVEEFIKSKGNE